MECDNEKGRPESRPSLSKFVVFLGSVFARLPNSQEIGISALFQISGEMPQIIVKNLADNHFRANAGALVKVHDIFVAHPNAA